MLIETDYLNYPSNQKQSFICKSAIVLRRRDTKGTKQYLIKCFRSMTMASLLSMLIETDYNFKKKSQQFFFGSCLKELHSVWNCLFIRQNAKLFQHNHLLFEICWGYLFCSIRLSPGCPFHPVVSKSCNRTEFGRTYRTYRIFTVLTTGTLVPNLNKLEAPSAYQRSSKCMKLSNKNQFYKDSVRFYKYK